MYYNPMNLKGIATADRILLAIVAIFGTATIVLGIVALAAFGQPVIAAALGMLVAGVAFSAVINHRR